MERSIGVGSSGSNSNSNSIYQKQGILGDRNAAFSAYRGPFHEKDGHATAGDDSTEISIFEAQKYFNESIIDPQKVSSNGSNNNNSAISTRTESPPVNNVVIDNMEQLSRSSWASSSVHNEYSSLKMGSNNYRARSFHAAATPTASSEASWNSQTGLLSHRPGTIAVSLRSPTHHHQHHDQKKKKSGMATSSSSSSPRLRWFSFPRRCPCSGKKSVRVEEKVSSQQQPVHASSPHYSAVAAVSPNSKTNAVRSISLDLRNQTSKSMSVVSNGTANLNSLVAESDQQHALWDQEHLRRWDGQGSVKMPTRNVLLTAVPAAAAAVPQMQGQQNANGFSFPILKANGRGTPSAMFKLQPQTVLKTSAEKPSLGSASHEGHSSQLSATTISIHKPITDHLSSLAGFTFAASPPKPRVIICNDDDLGSDASSDLFEIESLSTSTQTTATGNNNNNYPSMLYCRRDSMEDDAPSFNAIRGLYRRRSSLDIETTTASDCYEPSEASIDWSVTTAEGLDRPSISSEAEEFELEKMNRRRPSAAGNYGMLSCRWVSVGPNPVPRVASSSLAVNVGDEVLKHVHVGSRPPLPNKPRSSHLSIPYAT